MCGCGKSPTWKWANLEDVKAQKTFFFIVINMAQDGVACHLLTAKRHYKNGDYVSCLDMLQDIVQRDDCSESLLRKLHLKLGDLLHFELQRLDEAERHYLQCIEIQIDDRNGKCLFNYGQLLAKRERFGEAESHFLACLALDADKACVQLSQRNAFSRHHTSRVYFRHFRCG